MKRGRLSILYVLDTLAIGGAEVFLLKKMKQLREMGHQVNLAFGKKKGEQIDSCIEHYLNNEGLYEIPANDGFVRLVRQLKPQIVHTIVGNPKFLRMVKEYDKKVITISTQTGVIWESDQKFDHAAYTDALVTMAKYNIGNIKEMIVRHPKIIRLIENGVDVSTYREADRRGVERQKHLEKLGIFHGSKVVLHVSRINPIKNLEDSLKIADYVCERDPEAVFLLAGGYLERFKHYHQYLQTIWKDYGLDGRYYFLGEKDDAGINDLLSVADCVISTTITQELTSNALLEALAAGKPVVALNCLGITDVVHNGKNGYVVAASDIEKAAQCIEKVLNNDALRSRMGKRGRKLALQRFDLNRAVKRYEKLYFELIKSRTRL